MWKRGTETACVELHLFPCTRTHLSSSACLLRPSAGVGICLSDTAVQKLHNWVSGDPGRSANVTVKEEVDEGDTGSQKPNEMKIDMHTTP